MTRSRTISHLVLRSLALSAIVLLLAAQGAPLAAHAASSGELSLTPVIIDENAKPQDILKESIAVTNTTAHLLTLYPSVNDLRTSNGEQPFQVAYDAAQAQSSLSNWIELSRGVVSLSPGEEKSVPFVITVPRDAVAGDYHALISFANGSTRAQASAAGSLGDVTVNVTIKPDIKEFLQLDSFSTDNLIFSGDDALFTYQIQNTGNQPLDPHGSIRIYDRNGQEVASVNVNNQGKIISPDQVSQLASTWSAVSGFGQYKAVINVDYGTSQPASVQDVTYFWVLPWKEVLAISILALVGFILLAFYFERWFEDRHFAKLASAGLLKAEALVHLGPHGGGSAAAIAPHRSPPTAPNRAALDKLRPIQKKGRIADLLDAGRASSEPQARRQPTFDARPAAPPDTIDLKRMTQQPSKPSGHESEGHVINLKR